MDWAFRRTVAEARRHSDLYFACLLSEDRIHQALGRARWLWQGWIYTPAVTVWVFLSQCLSSDHSCRDAVARLIAWRLAGGLRPCSAQTGAYCSARDDLPEEACVELMRHTGRQVEEQAPAEWRWLGHRVMDVDGSTITMPDMPANQAEYPQLSSQQRGCGFPIARIVVVFSLAVGTVIDAAIGKYQGKQTGENSLFRTLHESLQEGDVVLADRYFSGWFDLALLDERGVHIVIRKHQLRPTDFRTGRRLGTNDHLVAYFKPQRPDWMSREQYRCLPAYITFREVRVRVAQQGFRTAPTGYRHHVAGCGPIPSRRDCAALSTALASGAQFAEPENRAADGPLALQDTAPCGNEFFMHLAAYNLIRQLMAVAAQAAGVEPWTVSFKGTLQTINNLLPLLSTGLSTAAWCEALLQAIATHVVGDRPDRFEPRVKKRRPKEYELMVRPRHEYKRRTA